MGFSILPSTRRMNKATKRFSLWQQAKQAATTPIAPTWKMRKVLKRQNRLQAKATTAQAAVATIVARRRVIRASRPKLLRWTPLLNRRERKLNLRISDLRTQEQAEGKLFKALEAERKAALDAKAKKHETRFKETETKLTPKLPALKKRFIRNIADIQRRFGASMHARLNPPQQAQLAKWFEDAEKKINAATAGSKLVFVRMQVDEAYQLLSRRRYRRAAQIIQQIAQM